MAVMGILLFWADRVGKKNEDAERIDYLRAFGIGVAQAAALIPGVSRSGATITVGLLFGYDRESIARFSFLLSTPIIFGAGLVKIPHLMVEMHAGQSTVTPAALAAGVIAAAVTGFIAVRFMLAWLKTNTYLAFAGYRVLVAVGIVALWAAGKR